MLPWLDDTITLSPILRSLWDTVDDRLVIDAFRDGDMDLLRLPFELSGGEVGVFWVGEASVVSGNGVLVNLVNRENIPRFGSHWKYRHPATDPSFLPIGSSRTTPAQSPGAN